LNNIKISNTQKIIISILLIGMIMCALLQFAAVRNLVIYLVEELVKGKPLDNSGQAHGDIKLASVYGVFVCIAFMPIIVFIKQITLSAERFFNFLQNKQLCGITIKDIFVEQPFMLILFIFYLYIVKNLFLAIHIIGFDIVIIILAILFHMITLSFACHKKIKKIAIQLIVCYSIVIASLVISSFIFDYSYDGQAYHQTAAIQINSGWNPFYANLPEESVFIWNNHYPKFTEIFTSIFLSAFNNIELGKSYNIIFLVIVFLYAFRYSSKFQKNKLLALIISIIFAANPVVLSQIFTNYVDGLLGMIIIILIFACMDYEQNNGKKDLFIIIAVSVFSINIKFTGFICGVILIGYIIKHFAANKFRQMFLLIIAGFIILLIGIVFTGYNPYIINIRYFGHPFYPLFGRESMNIIPVLMADKSTFEGFSLMHPVQRFFSLFFLNFDLKNMPFNPLKIIRLQRHDVYDLRIGGFGMLFAEFSIFIILILLNTIKNKNTVNYKKILFPISLLLFISVISPENWHARYIPFFWYLFGFILISSDYGNTLKKWLFFVCLGIALINNGTFLLGGIHRGYRYTKNLTHFIMDIKETKNDTIHIVLTNEHFKYSMTEKLRYYKIDKNIFYVQDSNILHSSGFEQIKGWY